MRRLSRYALVACATLIAACGGGVDKGSSRAVTVPAGRPLKLVADEYSLDPGKVTVARAGALEISLANHGVLAHNVRVERGGRDLGGTDTFQGGRTLTAAVNLKPGRYELLCTVGDHAALGMRGTLQVAGP